MQMLSPHSFAIGGGGRKPLEATNNKSCTSAMSDKNNTDRPINRSEQKETFLCVETMASFLGFYQTYLARHGETLGGKQKSYLFCLGRRHHFSQPTTLTSLPSVLPVQVCGIAGITL